MRKKKIVPNKETDMNSITDSVVTIQTSSQSLPSTPCWLGEVVLLIHHLRKQGVLSAIAQQVHFARRRFGHYEVIDFVAAALGSSTRGEPPPRALYRQHTPLFTSLIPAPCL